MLHEKLLQIFVCIVDAELLEAVCLKVFEAKDVENPYCTLITAPVKNKHVYYKNLTYIKRNILPDLWLVDCQVDLFDDENKEPAVDTLGKGISNVLNREGNQLKF